MNKFNRIGVGLAAMLLLGAITGCQTQEKLSAENSRLWTQNKELQDDVNKERAARDAAENERARLAAENNKLQGDLAAAKAQAATPAPEVGANTPVSTTTGFSGIAGVETEQRGGNVYVRVPGDVLFAPGKIAIKTGAKHTLDQIAAVLNKEYAGKKVRVEGYTDADPIKHSDWTDNLELSLERAAAVYRYLHNKGVDAKRLYAAGFGEQKPRATKAQSRRVEIVVVGND